VENVLIEEDQVAGFGHDDVCGQDRGCRTIDSKPAECVPEVWVVRTRQDAEGAVLRSKRLEVGEKADTRERSGRIGVPRSTTEAPYALCPSRHHRATE